MTGPMAPIRIFVSSVQEEFVEQRLALRDYVHGDPLMRRFFEVFLFEDAPAADRRPEALYLNEVERSDIYVGLFGSEYGTEPIPSYQVYQGTVFELVDQAVDFVLSKINRAIGTRSESVPGAAHVRESPRKSSPKPSSTRWRTETTRATAASRSCCSPTGWRSGIRAACHRR